MNPVMPGPGIPIATAEKFFDGLRNSELADAAKPIEELYRKNLELVESIKAKLAEAEQLAVVADELAGQYWLARTQLFLRKLQEKGLYYCDGPVGYAHVAAEVSPIFVGGNGVYITNVCAECAAEAKLKEWAERYRIRECRKEGGRWQIKKGDEWLPAPEETRDYTGNSLPLVLSSELEKEYGLPPEIRITADCRLKYTNEDWLRMAVEGFW